MSDNLNKFKNGWKKLFMKQVESDADKLFENEIEHKADNNVLPHEVDKLTTKRKLVNSPQTRSQVTMSKLTKKIVNEPSKNVNLTTTRNCACRKASCNKLTARQCHHKVFNTEDQMAGRCADMNCGATLYRWNFNARWEWYLICEDICTKNPPVVQEIYVDNKKVMSVRGKSKLSLLTHMRNWQPLLDGLVMTDSGYLMLVGTPLPSDVNPTDDVAQDAPLTAVTDGQVTNFYEYGRLTEFVEESKTALTETTTAAATVGVTNVKVTSTNYNASDVDFNQVSEEPNEAQNDAVVKEMDSNKTCSVKQTSIGYNQLYFDDKLKY